MAKKQISTPKDGTSILHDKRNIRIALGVILLVTCAALFPSLKNGFTNWDDDRYVTNNPLIQDLSWNRIEQIFSVFFQGNYHPLTLLSYAIEFQSFQLNPSVYHVTNLLLHLLNCSLVFWLIFKLGGDLITSFIVGILFGIHPLHVESVAWIAERKDVLYALFFLGAIISFLQYRQSGRNKRYYYVSLFLFLLSCLSKGMAVTLPLVLLLIDYYLDKKINKRAVIEKIPFLITSLLFGIVAILAQRAQGAVGDTAVYSVLDTVFIACYGVVFYIVKAVVPINLSAMYPYPGKPEGMLPTLYLISPVAVAALVFLISYSRRYTRRIIFGSAFFFICIVPVLQLLPVGVAVTADRYFYVSSIGIFYIVGEGFSNFYHSTYVRANRFIPAAIVLGILILSIVWYLTLERTKIWNNSISLFNDVLEQNPSDPLAYVNLGKAYSDAGKDDKAIELLRKVTELAPKYTLGHYNLGNAYFRKSLYDNALQCYQTVLAIDTGFVKAYYNIGVVYQKLGDMNQAIAYLQQAARRGHQSSQDWLKENGYRW